jgi:sphingolipid delta-4 desaturase
MYNSLVSHTSWTKLLFHFLFDPGMSLYSRQVRNERGHFTPANETRPDLEYLFDESVAQREATRP